LRDRRGWEALRSLAQAAALVATLAIPPPATAGTDVGPPVEPHVFTGDLRALPMAPSWKPTEPIRVVPRRRTHPEVMAPPSPRRRDPLLDLQRLASPTTRAFAPPELNFDGQSFDGAFPPDSVGDVGSAHYIQAVNSASGTKITIYAKSSGGVVAGPLLLTTLWAAAGACAEGLGDPIVLYDPLASRWLLAEFASTGNHLCVYLSRSNDPVTGGWLNYDFEVPEFPDYDKYAVWPQAYTVTTNEFFPAVYALDRAKMLAGLPASYQRFTAPPLSGYGLQTLTPADLDGAISPPVGSPAFFARQVDDEVTIPFADNPSQDYIEVWTLDVDFATPAESIFRRAETIPVAEFDTALCGTLSAGCLHESPPRPAQRLHHVASAVPKLRRRRRRTDSRRQLRH
jgi:hypothetical protein